MANALASSTIVPKEYQGNVSNALIAVEMAARLHTSPMMVMLRSGARRCRERRSTS